MITTKLMLKKLTMVVLSLLGIATFVVRVNAACDYGTALVTCHDPTVESWVGCCPGAGTCAGNPFSAPTPYSISTSIGRISTCAITGSHKYIRASAGFPGQCGYTITHVDCTGSWTENVTSTFTIYACEGLCGS